MKLQLDKLVATGNDFLFFMVEDGFNKMPLNPSKLIQKVCDRHYGIGADGFVVLRQLSNNHYEWRFFNCDGSPAAMCGNAARAAARFLLECAQRPAGVEVNWPIKLSTEFGEIELQRLSNENFSAKIAYTGREILVTPIQKQEKAVVREPVWLDTGVPHVVIEIDAKEAPRGVLSMDALTQQTLLSIAKQYRWANEVGATGANVTFFQVTNQTEESLEIHSLSFERGVEAFTLSCGTGVLASAFVASQRQKLKRSVPVTVKVVTNGGSLEVDLSEAPESLILIGPAQFVFTTEYSFVDKYRVLTGKVSNDRKNI